MNSNTYNPYQRVGELWLPTQVVEGQQQERFQEKIQQELTRQQKRFQERQRTKDLKKLGKWVEGVSK